MPKQKNGDDEGVIDLSSTHSLIIEPMAQYICRCPWCGTLRQRIERCQHCAAFPAAPPPRGFKSWATFADGIVKRYRKRCPELPTDPPFNIAPYTTVFDMADHRAYMKAHYPYSVGYGHPEADPRFCVEATAL